MSRIHYLQSAKAKQPAPYRFATHPATRAQMTKTEAQLLLNKAAKASNAIFASVVKLIARRGYRALGFKKPHDCLRKKLPGISNSYICRLLQSTDAYLVMDPKCHQLKWVSENTFRPLIHLPEKDLVAIWKWVLEHRHADTRITNRNMRTAMDALNIQNQADSTSDHQAASTARLNQQVLPKLNRHIFRIADAIRDSDINTEEEWRIVAKLVYQQVLSKYAGGNNCKNGVVSVNA